MSEWQELTIGELPLIIGDGNYSSKYPSAKEFKAAGIPFISNKDIKNGRILREGLRYITPEKHAELKKGHIKEQDILVSTRANIGDIAYVDATFEDANINAQLVFLRCDEKVLHSKFLYHLLSSKYYHAIFQNHASGSAQMQLPIAALREIVISFPEYDEQKAIAAVLSSLDDKIDLLHRQNKTLEAIAATLFRQWFVEDAQEDWEEKPLSNIANFLNGLACQKHPAKNDLEKLPVLKIRELSNGISEASDWASSKVKPEYIVKAGDVIFAWSASLMVRVWDGQECVLNQHLFKVTSDGFPKWFYLMWCKHHLAEFIAISASHATTMGHIKRGDLDSVMVIVPPENEIEVMSERMTPLLDKQIAIARQVKTLKKLRDSLLSKLMSGEVRVEV